MKRASLKALIIAATALTCAVTAQAATKKKPAKVASNLPQTLPAFKGKKKITVDFSHPDENKAVANDKTQLPIDKTVQEQAVAAAKVQRGPQKPPQAPQMPEPQAPQKPQQAKPQKAGTKFTYLEPVPVETPSAVTKTIVVFDEPFELSEGSAEKARIAHPAEAAKPAQKIESTTFVVAAPPTMTQASPSPAATAQNTMTTHLTETAPTTAPGWRGFFGVGAIYAKFNELEPELYPGATTLAVGLGKEWGPVEARGTLAFAHGFDQSITPQNTRYTMVRGDATYLFLRGACVMPFVSGALAYTGISVRSYRAQSGSTIVMREHVSGSAIALIPGSGARFKINDEFAIDATVEYLAFLGIDHASSLGGISGNLALNWLF